MTLASRLEVAQRRLEDLGVFMDSIRVTSDPAGASDDELDEDTGVLLPAGQTTRDLLGAVRLTGVGDAPVEGQGPASLPPGAGGDVLTPLSEDPLQVGDVVEVLYSVRDPHLVGARFVVTEVVETSLAVYRRAWVRSR